MVYKNAGGQSREQTMVAAWALVTRFGAKQVDVAKALGCSQPTVANWVKETAYRHQINGLEKELSDAEEYIDQLQRSLPYNEEEPDG